MVMCIHQHTNLCSVDYHVQRQELLSRCLWNQHLTSCAALIGTGFELETSDLKPKSSFPVERQLSYSSLADN
ncbi:hypothetical protein HanRHA438_Chr06g0268591 [Helianthus annuus]|nr:hypothetical protein HanPI659440_Chr06g0236261 [Helianthus annuus]KAJ0911927.1 hypothetical protein HanRHA438_Chr06g0268591 [Helianthus annuus]